MSVRSPSPSGSARTEASGRGDASTDDGSTAGWGGRRFATCLADIERPGQSGHQATLPRQLLPSRDFGFVAAPHVACDDARVPPSPPAAYRLDLTEILRVLAAEMQALFCGSCRDAGSVLQITQRWALAGRR